jgi:hypothetical protein
VYAAVVTSFDKPPHYSQFDEFLAAGETQAVVDVLAAGLHPRVRSHAEGSHYTSTGELPLIPRHCRQRHSAPPTSAFWVADWGRSVPRAIVDELPALVEGRRPLRVADIRAAVGHRTRVDCAHLARSTCRHHSVPWVDLSSDTRCRWWRCWGWSAYPVFRLRPTVSDRIPTFTSPKRWVVGS